MNKVSPVPDALVSQRFDVALSKMLGVSRAKAGALIADNQVSIMGRVADKSTRLGERDVLSLDIVEKPAPEEPEALHMGILYEDEDVVVVDKPVGVAAHASVGWEGPTVLGSLLKRGVHITELGATNRRGIVSRLDVGTSGAMLVCKSDLAYVEMRRQFSQHEVVKIYHAVAQGHLDQAKATIDAPIGRDRSADFRFTVTPVGKPAITHYDVLERLDEATLVKVNLETGRTHQIRVHFSSIGHPLVGDPLYGANPRLSERVGLDRQWLHAVSLEFKHPRTRLWTTVTSEYPEDLQRALGVLREDGVQPAE
ncbi:MAG: RluA family pseudouridine synthase [Bifidobacteriaceae bacterium]|jgi:23S rRNA pseudouridine1911/1915/1917 synthase|nr:RluA family pseudouridine synthase [Bifidobacteriaceae bacterium]